MPPLQEKLNAFMKNELITTFVINTSLYNCRIVNFVDVARLQRTIRNGKRNIEDTRSRYSSGRISFTILFLRIMWTFRCCELCKYYFNEDLGYF